MAFPVSNLEETKKFYTEILGAKIGRTNSGWMDFNLRWNQITVHESPMFKKKKIIFSSDGIPTEHFGVVLVQSEWEKLKNSMLSKGVDFLVKPTVLYEGQVGEQSTFFLQDPNGYAIEFKGFHDLGWVFRSTD
jgi:extradiol dioxygenase family protein